MEVYIIPGPEKGNEPEPVGDRGVHHKNLKFFVYRKIVQSKEAKGSATVTVMVIQKWRQEAWADPEVEAVSVPLPSWASSSDENVAKNTAKALFAKKHKVTSTTATYNARPTSDWNRVRDAGGRLYTLAPSVGSFSEQVCAALRGAPLPAQDESELPQRGDALAEAGAGEMIEEDKEEEGIANASVDAITTYVNIPDVPKLLCASCGASLLGECSCSSTAMTATSAAGLKRKRKCSTVESKPLAGYPALKLSGREVPPEKKTMTRILKEINWVHRKECCNEMQSLPSQGLMVRVLQRACELCEYLPRSRGTFSSEGLLALVVLVEELLTERALYARELPNGDE